ncbi:MAG: VWA domain-containing protein [Chloroflexaceae bacterium]|nr:VWA domain-containing protein [Chloroflexaceae bacterium]
MATRTSRLFRAVPLVLLAALLAGCAAPAASPNVAPQAPTAAPAGGSYNRPQAPAAATAAPAAAAAAPTAAAGRASEAQGAAPAPAAPAATAAPAAAAPSHPNVAGGTPAHVPPADSNRPAPVEVNPFVRTELDNLSTFAMDVDTGSYTAARNYLNRGTLPPRDMVRVEEFVNYFRYDYPAPQNDAFGIIVDGAPSPFTTGQTQFIRVGIQGRQVQAEQRKDAVLTFVVDASGSMDRPNRLPLAKESLTLLVNELRPNDQVGVVVFGSTAYNVLEPTYVSDKGTILDAINRLQIDGATNMEEGMLLGYQMASQAFAQGANNRVVVLSDGEANVGATGPDGILRTISDYRKQGIFLSTVGFGVGDYNDPMLEQLADAGDGNYSYIDTFDEARRVFSQNLTSTLEVIAKDAKVQVEFNPEVVAAYRLLGYENRAVADADFRNDRIDAGEIGAGHTVTALYEVRLRGMGDALKVSLRYTDPNDGVVREIAQPFSAANVSRDISEAPASMRLAVVAASLAEYLRESDYVPARALPTIRAIADEVARQYGYDPDTSELAQLVAQTESLGR